jgi:hypothetical protein
LREQPPSDSGAHLASAFSHILPGPPPNLLKYKIQPSRPPGRAPSRDFADLHSHRIRKTVTNDSIAPIAQPLIWGVFVRDPFASPGSRAAGVGFARMDCSAERKNGWLRALRASTKERNCRESDTSPVRDRGWLEERASRFHAGALRARAPIGVTAVRSRRGLYTGKLAVQSARRTGTGFLAELPPMALSHGEHATTAFAGR